MDTNELIETKGIVLNQMRYKEFGKILDVLTEDYGRINVFAGGVLKPKNKLMLQTEKFVESKFTFSKSKGKFYIQKAEVLNSNLEIGKNLKNYFLAELVSELLIKTLPENYVEKNVYGLTEKLFIKLREDNINIELLKSGFIIKYLSFIGFKPHLNSCVICGNKKISDFSFSNKFGGIICENCLENTFESDKISINELNLILKLLYSKFDEYDDINIDEKSLKKISNLIYKYMLYSTEIDFLDSQKKFDRLCLA